MSWRGFEAELVAWCDEWAMPIGQRTDLDLLLRRAYAAGMNRGVDEVCRAFEDYEPSAALPEALGIANRSIEELGRRIERGEGE